MLNIFSIFLITLFILFPTLSIADDYYSSLISKDTKSNKNTRNNINVLAEIVGGGNITILDFTRELKNLPEYLKAMAQTPQGRREMLDTMVIRELIMQQAAKEGLDRGPEIEEKLQDLKQRLIVESFLKKKVEVESKVSDEDMRKFYEQNKEKFKTGDQIKASHILVKTEKEAQVILVQLASGRDFEDLAITYSVDSSSAKGGDLGWFGKGSMVPDFENAALALNEGQISEVVKSEFGFHIIKLTGKRPAGIRPFEEVKEQIKSAIMPTKQQEVFQKIKEELKRKRKIKINEKALSQLGTIL